MICTSNRISVLVRRPTWRFSARWMMRSTAWQPISGTVKAPAAAARLSVELRAHGQKSANDVLWYDDAELYAISVN